MWPLVVIAIIGISRGARRVVPTLVGALVAVTLWRVVVYQMWGWESAYLRTDTRVDGLILGALVASLFVRGLTPARLPRWTPWVVIAVWFVAHAHREGRRRLRLPRRHHPLGPRLGGHGPLLRERPTSAALAGPRRPPRRSASARTPSTCGRFPSSGRWIAWTRGLARCRPHRRRRWSPSASARPSPGILVERPAQRLRRRLEAAATGARERPCLRPPRRPDQAAEATEASGSPAPSDRRSRRLTTS